VDVAPTAQSFLQVFERNFPVRAVHRDNSNALVQKSDGVALVRLDMRMSVTKHAMMARAVVADRQAVCRRTVENEKNFAVGFKEGSKLLFGFSGEFIRPVTDDVPCIETAKGFQNFRATPGVVVARKLSSMFEVPPASGCFHRSNLRHSAWFDNSKPGSQKNAESAAADSRGF
jgi:hypothetical protein